MPRRSRCSSARNIGPELPLASELALFPTATHFPLNMDHLQAGGGFVGCSEALRTAQRALAVRSPRASLRQKMVGSNAAGRRSTNCRTLGRSGRVDGNRVLFADLPLQVHLHVRLVRRVRSW